MDRKKKAIVRLEKRRQVSLRDSGGHRGRHQSQNRARLRHQFSQSQIQKAEGTQGRYGWPHTLPAHWTNWVGLNHINLTSHLPLPHIPHNIIRLAIVSNINCKRSFSLKSITWICMWEIYIYTCSYTIVAHAELPHKRNERYSCDWGKNAFVQIWSLPMRYTCFDLVVLKHTAEGQYGKVYQIFQRIQNSVGFAGTPSLQVVLPTSSHNHWLFLIIL